MLPNEPQRDGHVAPAHSDILGQVDFGFEPELRLATRSLNVHV
jgi:hypothetical protein